MYLATVVSWKHPAAKFVWNGEKLDGLTWLSVDIPKPTQEDLDAWTIEFEDAGGIPQMQRRLVQGRPEIRALATVIHKRFKLLAADTVTAQQWERMIADELTETLPRAERQSGTRPLER